MSLPPPPPFYFLFENSDLLTYIQKIQGMSSFILQWEPFLRACYLADSNIVITRHPWSIAYLDNCNRLGNGWSCMLKKSGIVNILPPKP